MTPSTNGRHRWLGLVALTIGVAMIIVDATIVNVAIPSIIRDLGIGITQAEWANSIYSLVFAALLISVGRIGDVIGRRRVFVWGLLVFLAREPDHRPRAHGDRPPRSAASSRVSAER